MELMECPSLARRIPRATRRRFLGCVAEETLVGRTLKPCGSALEGTCPLFVRGRLPVTHILPPPLADHLSPVLSMPLSPKRYLRLHFSRPHNLTSSCHMPDDCPRCFERGSQRRNGKRFQSIFDGRGSWTISGCLQGVKRVALFYLNFADPKLGLQRPP